MSITTIYSEKEKPGWTYDRKKKEWRGYLLDILCFDGKNKPLKRKRIQYSSKSDAVDAELEIETEKKNAAFGIYKTKETRRITLKELFDKRLILLTERKRRELERRVLNRFADICGEDFAVEDLKTSHIYRYAETRAAEKTARNTLLTPQTINRELTIISSALRQSPRFFAELEDYQPPRIPRQKAKENRRTRTTTPEEKMRLLAWLGAKLRDNETAAYYNERIKIFHALRFAWLTGARKKEVARIQWKDYDARRDRLSVYRYKNKLMSVFSPVPRKIKELFEERKPFSGGAFIFTEAGEFNSYFESIVEAACIDANINYGRFADDGFTFHTARHDFITNLIQKGVDIETVRELAGISKSEILLLYAHASAETRKRAVLIIDDF